LNVLMTEKISNGSRTDYGQTKPTQIIAGLFIGQWLIFQKIFKLQSSTILFREY